tara:strand:- start:2640 stop:3152 length:513 start_codon:yes stop_codon:yes gene_type:complete
MGFDPPAVQKPNEDLSDSQSEALEALAADLDEPLSEAPPTSLGLLTQGSATELMRQATIAQRLEEALSFLRTISKTRDYFVGYTISDVISERLARIGLKDDDESADAMVNGAIGRTEISKLNKLRVDLLGDPSNPANKGAIKQALELKEQLAKIDSGKSNDDPPEDGGVI